MLTPIAKLTARESTAMEANFAGLMVRRIVADSWRGRTSANALRSKLPSLEHHRKWARMIETDAKSQTVARPCANCVQLKSTDINWTYCWVLPRLILFMRPICLQAVLYTGCDSRTSQDIQFGMFVVEQVQRIDVKWGKFSFLLLHLFFSHLYSNRWSSQVLKATI